MNSGYLVKISMFIPADPMDPEGMQAALAEINRLKTFAHANGATYDTSTKFVRQRGKNGEGEPQAAA